jgi:O-antigen/teichoic acid export membrane protein
LFSLFTQAAPLVVALFAIPALLQHLGIERFGVLSLAWVVLGYATVLDLGVARAATSRIAQGLGSGPRNLHDGVGPTALGVNLVLGLLAGLVFAMAAPFLIRDVLRVPADLADETGRALLVIAAGIPVILVLSATRGVLEGAQRFDLVSIVAIPSTILSYLLPVFGAALGAPLWLLVLAIVLVRLAAAASYASLWRVAAPSLRVFAIPAPRLALNFLRYGGWLTVSNLTSPVVLYGERAIVGSNLGITGLGLYVIPYEVAARYALVGGALYVAVFPAFSMLAGRLASDVEAVYRRGVSSILLLLGPLTVVLVVFSADFLRLWLGDEIAAKTAAALQLFVAGALVNSLAYIPLAYLQASGRPDLPAKLQAAEIIPTFLLTLALSSAYGLPGAALAWCCRMTTDTALLFLIAGRETPELGLLRLGRIPFSIVGALVAILIAGYLARVGPWELRAGLTTIVVLTLIATMWRSSLTRKERASLLSQVRAFTPKRSPDRCA